jgi:TPR repeat protein
MNPRRLRLICLLWLASAAGAFAAPALVPALQDEVEAAVRAYDSGRLAPAHAAFESLAQRQVPVAQFNLAVMHLRGEVPQPDLGLARDLLQRAAMGGLVTAQLALGQALENGDLGERDLPLAHRWYQLAAAQGSVDAQLAVGTAHYLGRGLPKDPQRAAHWFREAAKGGDVGAMYLLASQYEQGDGVERDLRLARYWYEQAARRGDEAAPAKVQELDARLAAPPA